jgi:hypothetical protein
MILLKGIQLTLDAMERAARIIDQYEYENKSQD